MSNYLRTGGPKSEKQIKIEKMARTYEVRCCSECKAEFITSQLSNYDLCEDCGEPAKDDENDYYGWGGPI